MDRQKLARYERLLKMRSISQPTVKVRQSFQTTKVMLYIEEPNVCSIGVEAYTISRADESVLFQSQVEDRSVNSSERFGSE